MKPNRIIEADEISRLAQNGARVEYRNCIIRGKLDLKYTSITNTFSLVQCQLEESPDFSFASFEHELILSGTRFENGANFRGAVFKAGARLVRASFLKGKVTFNGMGVHGIFSARRATFTTDLNMQFVYVEKSAHFAGARFYGQVDLVQAHVEGEGDFRGCSFKGKASFNGATIDGPLFFRSESDLGLPGAAFEDEANFLGLKVGKVADFGDVRFNSKSKSVIFEGAVISGYASLNNAVFSGPVDFKGVSTLAAYFNGTHFTSGDSIAQFHNAQFHSELFFSNARFKGDAEFNNLCVSGTADFRGAVFEKKANFNSARLNGVASFSNLPEQNLAAACFWGDVDFIGSIFGSEAIFDNTRFKGELSQIYFQRTSVAGSLRFQSAIVEGKADFLGISIGSHLVLADTIFHNNADFANLHVGSDANLQRTKFKKVANFPNVFFGGKAYFQGAAFEGLANFNGADFRSDALFCEDVDAKLKAPVFEGVSVFFGARFASNAIFSQVQFKKNTQFVKTEFNGPAIFHNAKFLLDSKPDFTGAHFEGGGYFQGTEFFDEVYFRSSHFRSEARIHGANFNKKANFYGAHFDGKVEFCASEGQTAAKFTVVIFDHALFEGSVNFEGVIFLNTVSLQGTSLRTVDFAAVQFKGGVDLRGCTYESIIVDWRAMLNQLQPFDREAYFQLEKLFRAKGDKQSSDQVYLRRERIESSRIWIGTRPWPWRWLGNRAYKYILNYGVRPFRLIGISFAFLLLGMFALSEQGAAQLKEHRTGEYLGTRGNAFWFSVHQFSPLELPVGSQWEPTDQPTKLRLGTHALTSTEFVTLFLRIPGYLIVPLGVAALGSLLRRKDN